LRGEGVDSRRAEWETCVGKEGESVMVGEEVGEGGGVGYGVGVGGEGGVVCNSALVYFALH